MYLYTHIIGDFFLPTINVPGIGDRISLALDEGGLSTELGFGIGAMGTGADFANTMTNIGRGYDVSADPHVAYTTPAGLIPFGVSLSVGYAPNTADGQGNSAKNTGAVASPTAGLHFNKNLMKDFEKKNIETIFTTLHVGAGTFLPLKDQNIKKNTLHKERGVISSEAANKINIAISEKKRIVAVGTTVVRLLEACYSKYKTIKNFNEDIDLFIYPGYKFKVIDKLITNFHLPKSSLLILVSSFSTKNKIKEYYEFAVENNMKFFSFGDAMLLDKYEF